MKVLVLGGSGMLGHRLWIELSHQYETIATLRGECPKIKLPSISGVDVFDFDNLRKVIHSTKA